MWGNFDVSIAQGSSWAQGGEEQLSSIILELMKLREFGRVLYVGAHPDDENNKLIAYLAKERFMEVAYLSLTRGEGGQNFIGAESGDDLGILRAQESLQARRVDGGRQFFTRAKDFGFSKCAQESISVWGEEATLEDIVYIIRYYQPDIIISRFSPVVADRHGHHQASAILIGKAFALAAEKSAYPNQLAQLRTWRAKQLLWNVYAESGVKEIGGQITPKHDQIPLFIPAKSRYSGQSFSRLAAESRNQHRCQAMACLAGEGASFEYFEWLAGAPLLRETFLHATAGETTISRFEFKQTIDQVLNLVGSGRAKSAALCLQRLLQHISTHADDPRVTNKRYAIEQLLLRLLGLEVSAYGNVLTACPGEEIKIALNVSHDALLPLQLIATGKYTPSLSSALLINSKEQLFIDYRLPADTESTHAAWLKNGSERGRYLTKAIHEATTETDTLSLSIDLKIAIAGQVVDLTVPILAGTPSEASSLRGTLLTVSPPVCAMFEQHTLLIADEHPALVKLRLKALGKGTNKGNLRLTSTSECTIFPQQVSFTLAEGEEQVHAFALTIGASPWSTALSFEIEIGGKIYRQAMKCIDYPHITPQYYFPKSKMKVVKAVVNSSVKRIAYIKAKEDDVAEALASFVEQVDCYEIAHFLTTDISAYDAIVLGIRLYNYSAGETWHVNSKLRDYVERGGLVIGQYNTDYDLEGTTVCPYPIQLSSNRITNADSTIRFVGNHRILHYPNVIDVSDFDGWAHDRALFLPQTWDKDFVPVLSSADQGCQQESGLLLVAKKGNGYFVYTALSLFRQLPLAVPGAYRLFANLLNYRELEQSPRFLD